MDKLDLLVFKEFANGKIQKDKLELDKRGFYKIGRFQMKQLQYISKKILAELKKKDKIINKMAEVLNDFDYDKQCEICHTYICSASVDGTGYMKCIIDYFTNKIEEE